MERSRKAKNSAIQEEHGSLEPRKRIDGKGKRSTNSHTERIKNLVAQRERKSFKGNQWKYISKRRGAGIPKKLILIEA